MKALIGVRTEDGYRKVGMYRVRKSGGMTLPHRFHGTLEGALIRYGVRDCLAAGVDYVEVQFGGSATYRISLC